jgi:signal transduction histidine kinase
MPKFSKLKQKLLPAFLLGLGALLLIPDILLAQDLTSPLIKSGLILKFAQHVEWKQEENIDTFRIGVYGEEPELMANLLLLESVNLKGKPTSIRQFTQLNDISGIHLLYFTREKNSEIQRIANHIAGNQTLMVSDRVRNKKLIMINFLPLLNGKVDFEINKANITKARLDVTPALLLLGGTDVDVAGLYKQSQRTLKRFKTQIDELSESYNSKSKQIESLNQEILTRNQEIEEQSEEIVIQKELNDEQMRKYQLQQEQMDAREEELANVLEEVEIKQQTLDSKIELIRNQEQEINSQRAEIQNRNSILKEQEDEIQTQEKKIEEQVSQLSKFANRVARQRVFLYIVIAVCFLIGGLVFFIYRGYKIKRDANWEIQMANEEVVATNEALEDQKKELLSTLENLKLTQSQLIQAEKMASVGVLTAGIAHELNNPINFVSGNVNPLRRDLKDIFSLISKYDDIIETRELGKEFHDVYALKDQLDYSFLIKEITNLLEGISEGANRSSQIVKGLRSFSRLDEEQCQIYDIHEGIESSLILLHNRIKNRIAIHRDYDDFKNLECYPSKLNQVVMNILTNSTQAIEEEGDIYIQTVSSENGFKIIIKDNGRGMDPEVRKHIFEPFYTTKEVGKGTGLGLSISFGIIEQHKGHIEVISEPNKGTEFIISLPKTQSE